MNNKKSYFKSALNYEGKILSGYRYQIEVQNELLKKIRSTLPIELASHALYCVVSDKKILLYTDSATWSSQLRFYHKAIVQGLSSSDKHTFESVQIKIIPRFDAKKENSSKKIPSIDNIKQILLQAENQTDEKLKLALKKLGKTLKKSKSKIS